MEGVPGALHDPIATTLPIRLRERLRQGRGIGGGSVAQFPKPERDPVQDLHDLEISDDVMKKSLSGEEGFA